MLFGHPGKHANGKDRALSDFALDGDGAPHQRAQLLTERQPKAGAAIFAGGRTVGLAKILEQPADIVFGDTGWQDYAAVPAKHLSKMPRIEPMTHLLSVYGIAGLTAYFGLLHVGRPKAGETVVVSAAAGSVGSIVGQIAKIKGCRVIGIAGGKEKCQWLTSELGFDAAVDYKDGAVLHTGYYVDGQLHSFKNFYPDGKTERDFHQVDYNHNQMTLWYPDGKVRSDIIYYQDMEESTHEFYPNGNPEIAEEYAKKCEYLMFRTFYYENGKTQSDLQLVDKKKKKYYLKEYYENGNLQDEGTMQYYPEIDNYMKEGSWKVYDETGKQIASQEYVHGQMTEEKKL